jgi:DNA mismatch repair protein MutS
MNITQQLSQEFPSFTLHKWYTQFRELKAEQPDAVLFYRLGDFYEAFDDDAKLIAELLDVTLTYKDFATDKNGQKQRCPMAGMPYHAIESYVAKLVGAGYRVAIAEQISETASSKSDTRPRSVFAGGIAPSSAAKGMVERQIVRIVTPGTVIDGTLLNASTNNYIVAVIADGDAVGLAYADVSTGEFACCEIRGALAHQQSHSELARLNAAEVLVSSEPKQRLPGLDPKAAGLSSDLEFMTKEEREMLLPHERVARRVERESAARWAHGHITNVPTWRWELKTAAEAILRHLSINTLSGLGLSDRPLAVRAAGALLQYAQETQQTTPAQLSQLHAYTPGAVMFLDPQTRRNLELLDGVSGTKGSLIGVLDLTRTPMGARLLRRWVAQPRLDKHEITQRLDDVQHFVSLSMTRNAIREALRGIGDMERTVNRMLQGVSVTTPRDMVRLRDALRQLPTINTALSKTHTGTMPIISDDDLFAEPAPAPTQTVVDVCDDILAFIEQAIDNEPPALLGASNYLRDDDVPRRVIRPGFVAEMDRIVDASRDAQRWISDLEASEQQRTGIKSLKVDYNKVFGYYIEVSKAQVALVPSHYIRKQTLSTGERYYTDELKTYEDIVINAQERLNDLERQAFFGIVAHVASLANRLVAVARTLAHLDVVTTLAEVAVNQRYVRPHLVDEPRLTIVAGRHPVVEQHRSGQFIPNSLTLDANRQIAIITGANMTGKSTVMRQMALIVLMAQIGSFVPAERAEIGLVDRIFTRIGAQDDIATGQSTFMVEMTETAAILAQCTSQSLIILDEVGRGTSTYDGMAIAQALVEYLHNDPRMRCRTLFATHYHELTQLDQSLSRLINLHMAAMEHKGEVVFLHELRPGGADRSYGIHVAQIAGIPRSVTKRAGELLRQFEQGHVSTKLPVQQSSLFDAPPASSEPHPVVEALRQLNPNELTPIEALTRLYALVKQAHDE